MIVANTADLHFRGKDLSAKARQWEACLRICAERGVELLTCAGDILDKSTIGDKAAPDGAVMDAFKRPLVEWLGDAWRGGDGPPREFLTIVGNHDKAGAYSMDSLTFLDGTGGVRVSREPETRHYVRTRQAGLDELYVCTLPWDWAGGNPSQIVRDMRSSKLPRFYHVIHDGVPTLLLAHVQFHGGLMNDYRACDKTGEECPPGDWHMDLDAILPLFTRVAGGDFHRHQPGFVGALAQNSHDETGNPAGFEIWNTATNEVEWIELDEAPRYFTVPVESPEEIDLVLAEPRKPNTIIRYQCAEGIMPTQEQLMRAEAARVDLDYYAPRLERMSRVDAEEAPPEIIDQPHRLIDLWASKQEPEMEPARIAAMHEEYDRSFAGVTT